MKLHAEKLSSQLQNNLAPCYLVSGDEHLLIEEALDEIRAAARERGFESRESFVAMANFNWSQLSAVASNLSLFADKRIIELRLPTGKPGREGSAAICEFVATLSPEFVLIVIAPKLNNSNRNSKWVKTLSASGDHVPIWEVDLRNLPGWISGRMRGAGLKTDREAVRMIADRVEGNLLAANQEIEKLRIILGEGAVSGEDQLSVGNGGTVILSGTDSGATVSTTASGVIGTLANAIGADNILVINFDVAGKPTFDDVNEILRALTYENLNTDNPAETARTVSVTLDDGEGGVSTPANVTVTVTGVDDAPVVTTNQNTNVTVGGTVFITTADLEVTDVDNTAAEGGGVRAGPADRRVPCGSLCRDAWCAC